MVCYGGVAIFAQLRRGWQPRSHDWFEKARELPHPLRHLEILDKHFPTEEFPAAQYMPRRRLLYPVYTRQTHCILVTDDVEQRICKLSSMCQVYVKIYCSGQDTLLSTSIYQVCAKYSVLMTRNAGIFVLLALSVAIFFVEQDRIPSRCLFLEVAGFSAFIWFPSQFRINHPKTLGFYFGCR